MDRKGDRGKNKALWREGTKQKMINKKERRDRRKEREDLRNQIRWTYII